MKPSLRLRKGQKSATPSGWKARLVDVAILAAAAIVCLFVFSFSTRLSYSRPEVREAPEIIRVQILNGSGKAGMARKVADHLTMLSVGRMRFDAIELATLTEPTSADICHQPQLSASRTSITDAGTWRD
jgi:hypothetical protein